MRYIALFFITLIVGCDSLYGLRVPVEPAYKGDLNCMTENVSSIGLVSESRNFNQLSLSSIDSHKYLFTVIPNYNGKMELYFMQVHSAPSCDVTNTSFTKMKEFIHLMEQKCDYVASPYKAEIECRSN